MPKIGLDIGTGFVKCVSDYGEARFPSVYVRRMHGHWSDRDTEAVGDAARSMIDSTGATVITPITRGTPDFKYQKQVDLLLHETMERIRGTAKMPVSLDTKVGIVVGLPYHALGTAK